ncbi:Lon protease-like protein [Gluconacetobacter sp. SXCC-1]|uniref:AAA family ATPase n=1 Tax=Komagataeibacter rhaeticus TaxID=215221 RepID=A0A181CAR5_9PROT|nr:AAA family ATPase [Komagataeibacter rhaeticus]ATU72760.1 hypothetical protein CT154_07800 [Komagataeibacter xylinus]EGG76541.1 Lon protease-like protein [Gluconacetobacter sp. SXCC-1]QIP35436.1 AAA family ATPase [Komagataeibacter rhaeticus]SAY48667.1 Lon protease 2 [Komagataeibacter rhaeticus]
MYLLWNNDWFQDGNETPYLCLYEKNNSILCHIMAALLDYNTGRATEDRLSCLDDMRLTVSLVSRPDPYKVNYMDWVMLMERFALAMFRSISVPEKKKIGSDEYLQAVRHHVYEKICMLVFYTCYGRDHGRAQDVYMSFITGGRMPVDGLPDYARKQQYLSFIRAFFRKIKEFEDIALGTSSVIAGDSNFTYKNIIKKTVQEMLYINSPDIFQYIVIQEEDIPPAAFSMVMCDVTARLISINGGSYDDYSNILYDRFMDDGTRSLCINKAKELYDNISRFLSGSDERKRETSVRRKFSPFYQSAEEIMQDRDGRELLDRQSMSLVIDVISGKKGDSDGHMNAEMIMLTDDDDLPAPFGAGEEGGDDDMLSGTGGVCDNPVTGDDGTDIATGNAGPDVNRKDTVFAHEVVVFRDGIPDAKLKRHARNSGAPSSLENLCAPLPLKIPAVVDTSALERKFPHARHAIREMRRTYDTRARFGKFIRPRPILLVGPSGTGKSTLAREFFRCMDIPTSTRNVSSMPDSFYLTGNHKGFSESGPSEVLEEMARTKCPNMAFILDEIDKAPRHRDYGCFQDALLMVLDRKEAETFKDFWLNLTADLSWLSWVLTANDVDRLTAPLRSRCTVIQVNAPTASDVPVLARNLIREIEEERGLYPGWYQLDNMDMTALKKVFRGDLRTFRKYVEVVADSKDDHMVRA